MEARFAINDAVDKRAFRRVPVVIVAGNKRRAAIVLRSCNLIANLGRRQLGRSTHRLNRQSKRIISQRRPAIGRDAKNRGIGIDKLVSVLTQRPRRNIRPEERRKITPLKNRAALGNQRRIVPTVPTEENPRDTKRPRLFNH